MMYRILLALGSVLLAGLLNAQLPGQEAAPDPVKWSITSKSVGEGVWELVFRADIQSGWSVYSQVNYGDMGPWPTSVVIDSIGGVQVVGEVAETGEKVIDGHDPVFDMQVKKFKGWATFTQRISTKDAATPVTGHFEYMTCDDEMCLPPATVYYILGLGSGTYELGDISFDPNDPKFAGIEHPHRCGGTEDAERGPGEPRGARRRTSQGR